MPCQSYGSFESDWQAEINTLTDLLCSVMRHIESVSPSMVEDLSDDVQCWWGNHCQGDLSRYSQEVKDLLASESSLSSDQKEAVQRILEIANRTRRR